jgi:hypothetical protein
MAKVKSLTTSNATIGFGYETFDVDGDGFAEVSDETKAHILSSQPELWADPDTDPIRAQMKPKDAYVSQEQQDRAAKTPDPQQLRRAAGVNDATPMPPVKAASDSGVVAPLSAGTKKEGEDR